MKNANQTFSLKLILGRYQLKSIIAFNTQVSSGSYQQDSINNSGNEEYNLALDDPAWKSLLARPNKDFPSQLLVAYDVNGREINAGSYKYDDEALLVFNINLKLEPRRDYDHLFVKGHDRLANEISNIYHLSINDKNIYFEWAEGFSRNKDKKSTFLMWIFCFVTKHTQT